MKRLAYVDASGPDMAVIAVALPEDMVEKRRELEERVQELIDEWEAKKDAELDQLVEQIRQLVEAILGDLVQKAKQALDDLQQDGCGGASLALAMLAFALVWRRR